MKPFSSITCLAMACGIYFASSLFAQDYKGASYCLNCHSGPQGGHPAVGGATQTYHNTSLRDPDSASFYGPPGVVSHNQWLAGLDLVTSPNFAAFGENAPVLSYDSSDPADPKDGTGGYKVTIGAVTYTIFNTYGGHGSWKQRYMTKIGESIYILPIQWNEKTKEWVRYNTSHWYGSNNLPLYTDPATLESDVVKANSFERRCQGCHSTGLKLAYDDTKGWVNTHSEFNNLCERCHGASGPVTAAHTGGTGLLTGNLTKDQKLELCGQCHSRGVSVGKAGGKNYDFPVNLTGEPYKIGEPLSDYFTFVTPASSASDFWPDGIHSKSHHQQFLDYKHSAHYSNPWVPMDCTSCHDPHQAPGDHMVVDQIETTSETGQPIVIATNNDDNTLCLACHATHGPFAGISKEMVADAQGSRAEIAAVVSQHTKHGYDPDGPTANSRCSKCHMPNGMKSAVNHDIHSHTFEVVMPEATLKYKDQGGMFNSCALNCHNKWGTDQIYDNWTESTDIALASKLHFKAQVMWGEPVAEGCDFNNDGKLSMRDVWHFLSIAAEKPYDTRLDWNKDGAYNGLDMIELLRAIWTRTCPENSTLLASASPETDGSSICDLTPKEASFISEMAINLELTAEQEAELRTALSANLGRSTLPMAFALSQNAPNPFNPATTISYSIPEGASGLVSLKVYDMRGRLVRTLVDEEKEAGSYTIFWDGTAESGNKVASGVYFYRMISGSFSQTRKMVLLK